MDQQQYRTNDSLELIRNSQETIDTTKGIIENSKVSTEQLNALIQMTRERILYSRQLLDKFKV